MSKSLKNGLNIMQRYKPQLSLHIYVFIINEK